MEMLVSRVEMVEQGDFVEVHVPMLFVERSGLRGDIGT